MTLRRSHKNAFTLTEMLVVISIIVMVFSIGTAFLAFSQSKYQLQATSNSIMSALRRARSEAMNTGAPVTLELETSESEEGQINFYPEMKVASWEFDHLQRSSEQDGKRATIKGAFGHNITCDNRVKRVLGSAGAALEFLEGSAGRSNQNHMLGRCHHRLNLKHRAAEGYIIRFSYWTGEVTDELGFLTKKGLFKIGLNKNGRFIARFGKLTAVVEKPPPPTTWVDVRVTLRKGDDTQDLLTIHQNGRMVAERKGNAELRYTNSASSASDAGSGEVQLGVFPDGFSRVRLDRLRYSRIIKEELGTLPKQVMIEGDRNVTFENDGSANASSIELSQKGIDRSIQIRILPTGAIERIDRNASSGPGPSAGASENRTSSPN